jgi:hypothetical protein
MTKRVWWICACVGLAAGTAWGQAAEGSLSFGRSIFTDKSIGDLGVSGSVRETLKVGDGFRLTARFTVNNWRFFGHEFGYGYNRSSLDFGSQGKTGMNVHQGFYNFLVYALPEGSSVRPFAAGGGGFTTFYPPGTSVFSGNGFTKVNYNYGGGVKFRLSPIYGLRFDVRDYVSGKPFGDFFPNVQGMLHNVEASAGFAILF